MITYIKIDGFKSFHNFEMDFTPLTVIAGSNAAGKSNIFDALKLLSSLADADKIQKSFREQRGGLLELFTMYDDHTYADRMSFVVEMLVNPHVVDTWGGSEQLKYTRLRYELVLHRFTNAIGMDDVEVEKERLDTIKHDSDRWIKILPSETANVWRPKVVSGKRQIPYMYTDEYNGVTSVIVPQDGSQGKKRGYPLKNATKTVLSSFDSVDFKHILAAREEMKSWRFLQLNPEELRRPTNKTTGEDMITYTGGNLAAALYRIKQEDSYNLKEISRKLNEFIPDFVSVDVIDDKENKQYIIVLKDRTGKKYTSRVLSEGTMRILTLCVLWRDSKHNGLLCFEEPENGIHPFRMRAMAQLLKNLSTDFMYLDVPLRQVIINTHSTIFVEQMNRWIYDPCVTIAFAQSRSTTVSVNGSKSIVQFTKVTPVMKDDMYQFRIPFSDQEKRLSLQMIREYLDAGSKCE